MKKIISTDLAPKAIGPYSQAVSIDLTNSKQIIYTSGQLPIDPKSGKIPETIEEQTQMSLNNVQSIVEHAGMTLSNVIKTTVFLDDIKNFKAMNEVYMTYFTSDFPSRSAFQVANLPLGVKVEIEVVAAK